MTQPEGTLVTSRVALNPVDTSEARALNIWTNNLFIKALVPGSVAPTYEVGQDRGQDYCQCSGYGVPAEPTDG